MNIAYVVALGRWRYEVNVGIYSRIGRLTAFLAERVTNIYLIRSFTNEKEEEKKGLEAARGRYDADMKSARVSFVASIASSVMELLQRGVPIIFGMILLQKKYINMQQWIAFFSVYRPGFHPGERCGQFMERDQGGSGNGGKDAGYFYGARRTKELRITERGDPKRRHCV